MPIPLSCRVDGELDAQMEPQVLGTKRALEETGEGRSGGLILFWKATLDVSIHSYSSGHIDCLVKHFEKCWRFTRFYGNPEVSKRYLSWKLLWRLFGNQDRRGVPWLVRGDFNEICIDREKVGVAHGWCSSDATLKLSDHINKRKLALSAWAGDRFRRILRKIKQKRALLNRLKTKDKWHDSVVHIQELEKQIEHLSSKEKIYWKQCSRVNWLAHGDKIRNSFMRVLLTEGRRTLLAGCFRRMETGSEKEGMAEIVVDYFSNLFKSDGPSMQDMNQVIDCVQPKINAQMNSVLCVLFSGEEVKKALFDMYSEKSPGPDGMSASFSRNIGRKILDMAVDEFQSAFVPGRLITDNILLGFEALHWILSKKKGNKGYVALKLDISKAYDRVEWGFLERIMGKLGFDPIWIEKVMCCVRTVNYLFVLNGDIVGHVNLRRGLRQGWGDKTFSAGGKKTLIKSVLQSIPTYAMSCFHIPKSICEAIEQECANFWWGMEEGRKRMHWIAWHTLCEPKCMGGMGFRNLEMFNGSLLAKQVWRISINPESLVAQVLKARFFKYNDIMDTQLGNNPSFIWSSLLWSRELLRNGLCWRVGNGKNIATFRDQWIPRCRSLKRSDDTQNYLDMVKSLIENGAWNELLIRSTLLSYLVEDILAIPIASNRNEDSRFWLYEPKGKYTVLSGYKLSNKAL
ncbi:uncharacterized protein [Primulina eburnea]|uniref:uncharacterized protein n=1 Tax=Primulina eburnea TaxID=1245227 RepID=UPI003C6C862C